MEAMTAPGTTFPLSSLGTRVGESSMATFLCTGLRGAFDVDVAILEGGSVRAGTDKYATCVTMSDLKAELPFKNNTLVVRIPGQVLSDAVRSSREKAAKGKYAFFLHCDSECVVDPLTHCLTQVAGTAFDPDRTYSVALGVDLGVGSGVNEPLMTWAAANPDEVPDSEHAIPAEPLLEVFFIRRMWATLPGFEAVDTTFKGHLTKAEIEAVFARVFFTDLGQLDEAQRSTVTPMVQHLTRLLFQDGKSSVLRGDYDDFLRTGMPASPVG